MYSHPQQLSLLYTLLKHRYSDSCAPEVESNNCYVYKGEMTVLHDDSADAAADAADIEAAVLAAIEDTTTSGELTTIDTVEKVTYLGSDIDDVIAALGPGFGTIGPIDQISGNNKDLEGQEQAEKANDDSKVGTIVGVSVAAALILLLLALLVRRRSKSRSVEAARGFKPGMELDEMNSFEDGELDENVNGMLRSGMGEGADHDAEPGSFHLGQFHYTRDGVRYLSPSCKLCAANGGLGTIPEDGLDRDNSFVRADSRNLGGKHSAHDVHDCSSATCQRCQNGTPGSVAFIKTGDATLCQPIREEEEDGNEEDSRERDEQQKPRNFAFWKR